MSFINEGTGKSFEAVQLFCFSVVNYFLRRARTDLISYINISNKTSKMLIIQIYELPVMGLVLFGFFISRRTTISTQTRQRQRRKKIHECSLSRIARILAGFWFYDLSTGNSLINGFPFFVFLRYANTNIINWINFKQHKWNFDYLNSRIKHWWATIFVYLDVLFLESHCIVKLLSKIARTLLQLKRR